MNKFDFVDIDILNTHLTAYVAPPPPAPLTEYISRSDEQYVNRDGSIYVRRP